ncbi:MAG: undecaprenyldiphospho-muramoylpentapeptide beta-N-acetylglucosaminyltransferase [Paludibacteraceae bacterium]|nr:undecaprenyldiphospho-muramoylpentapeptide beta-N-acetylglucosaminyltransferase [Paludibacteraceae bacterium]
MSKEQPRFLISGGGTGGHIFPAVSIANALKQRHPDCEILFVGANDRMEMERVPAAGYRIVGLPVRGFFRTQRWRNVGVVFDVVRSMLKVRNVIKEFRPDVAIGVGGYASGAAMKVAAQMGVPLLLQEQNGFAGVTNKMLANNASTICVAYDGMERFFPKEKIVLTGNPVRQNLAGASREEAYRHFGFSPNKKTMLVIGGSLGAKTVNESVLNGLEALLADGTVQLLWQTGKSYIEDIRRRTSNIKNERLIITDFVDRMDLAYAMADVVVSRAGASSISELCLLGKASILVPSPNVAEDHQTHNAVALVNHDAALMVKDVDAEKTLIPTAMSLLANDERRRKLSDSVLKLAQRDSAIRIAEEVEKLMK